MDGSRSVPRLSAAIPATAASVIICLFAGLGLASCPKDLLGHVATKPANPAVIPSDMRTLMRLLSAVRVVEPPRTRWPSAPCWPAATSQPSAATGRPPGVRPHHWGRHHAPPSLLKRYRQLGNPPTGTVLDLARGETERILVARACSERQITTNAAGTASQETGTDI